MRKFLFMLLLSYASLFAFEELTVQNFDDKIKGKNVIVDIYATWCPPCKIVAQNLEEFDEEKLLKFFSIWIWGFFVFVYLLVKIINIRKFLTLFIKEQKNFFKFCLKFGWILVLLENNLLNLRYFT